MVGKSTSNPWGRYLSLRNQISKSFLFQLRQVVLFKGPTVFIYVNSDDGYLRICLVCQYLALNSSPERREKIYIFAAQHDPKQDELQLLG